MKKKLLVGAGVVVAVIAALASWVVLVGNKRSPKDTVSSNVSGVDIQVEYCRPFKKERLIFGEEKAGALVPFNEYWRLGANVATTITFSKNISFAGKPVNAGTYTMYAVPGPTTWKVVLNSEVGRWGAREADHGKDVLTVEVPAEQRPAALEQFTIGFDGTGGSQMFFAWDTTVVHVPLGAAN